MRRRRVLKKSVKRFFKVLIILVIFLLGVGCFLKLSKFDMKKSYVKIGKNFDIEEVKNSYSDFVKAKNGAKLYVKEGNQYKEFSTIYGNIELKLDANYEVVDKYFKVLDSDYYISYDMVDKIDELSSLSGEYKYYKNYIKFDESISLKEKAKLYVNDESYYEVSGGIYPIIIKDEDKYGIEFNNSLVYVNSSDGDVSNSDSDSEYASYVSVLNYHYVVSASNENGELSECQQEICIKDTMFEKHVSYLRDNGYYGASIRDLELFIDGKVRLPKKSVLITIDDGWYVNRSINILEKYQMLGTLFLIGSLASPDNYRSSYLEIHSHTWDMHTLGQCPSSVGRGGILCLDRDVVLEDLKKSRESLDNTTYFCYPFYDYNDRAIELLKEAGFTMAFAGEKKDSKVREGQDKYKIPRYVIVSYTTMDQFISYVS